MSTEILLPLRVDKIVVPEGRRPVDRTKVKQLAQSIERIGLRHPVTVRRKGEDYVLVAGLHRLEAYRLLGRDHVPTLIASMTNAQARMWEIAENLHRAELTVQERADLVAEWIECCDEGLSQLARNPKGGRPGAIQAAAHELGIPRDQAHRSIKIASISERAKEAARAAGIDNNQSKLLKVAAAAPAEQVEAVRKIVEPLSDEQIVDKHVSELTAVWNRASPTARGIFLRGIGASLRTPSAHLSVVGTVS